MRPSRSRQVHPTPVQGGRLDPKIWRACAGGSFRIAPLHSRVYYFPQGHIEHASSAPQYLNPLIFYRPLIPCRVSAIEFLADPATDEVFAKLSLLPLGDGNSDHFADSLEAPDDDKVVSFAKVLTRSDANNGGGFSVPRDCADSIFPPLNFQGDRPIQTLYVKDVHGKVWEFRHIYRGTPRRHLLTTGWSKFVNSKKLVAGDSVVFMKNSAGMVFVGIRRAFRFAKLTTVDCSLFSSQLGGVRNKPEGEQQTEGYLGSRGKEGFSRDGKGRLSAKEVADAADLAAQNMPFEVVYYPRVGWTDFVVKAEAVEKAWNVAWTAGMRVKMPMETQDSSRITWFQGTVSSASAPDNGLWRGSPWRMLQTDDENEDAQNDVKLTDSEEDKVSPSCLIALIEAYKEARLDGDEKTASHIEMRMALMANQKNELIQRVSTLSAEEVASKEKYLRLQADFDNFRKRFEKDKHNIQSNAQVEVIEKLLLMVDNFDRTKQQIKQATDKEKKIDASYQGIYKQFVEILRSHHVAVVAAVGKRFDPLVHEAVAREENQEYKEGIIIQESRRGFCLEIGF